MITLRNQPESWKLWKNGGGLTREIAVYPESAGTEDFLWRVSIAKIERPGPFSRFPHARRRLMLLEGKGIFFQFADRAMTLNGIEQTIEFSGEEDLDCSPIDGACLVLNVMTRGDMHCEMRVIQDGMPPTTCEAARIIIAVGGTVGLIEDSGAPEQLQAGDAALLSPHARLQVDLPGETHSRLVELVFRSDKRKTHPIAAALPG
jgi:environmental stress-induced protein Ves